MGSGVGQEAVHLQVYAYNELFDEALKTSILGPIFRIAPALRHWLLGRILIVQGYLHSRYSTPIQLELKRSGDGPATLSIRGELSKAVRSKIRETTGKLRRLRRPLGGIPIAPWMKVSPPGQGFHNVATFPMRRDPQRFQSDIWGRPHGFQRVYAVDAAVLPSAPATTITFTVMANAHRIGSEAPLS
jgi:choline dehydrogenase-like flavoprotein